MPTRPLRPISSRRRRPAALAAIAALAAGGTGVLAVPGTAPPAAATPKDTVTAAAAVERSCFAKPEPGAPGIDTTSVTAATTGLIQARLSGGGDWDLAVFDAATGRNLAASAGPRSNEVAEGFVTEGQQLLVQACRYDGATASAALSFSFIAAPSGAGKGTASVVDVSTPTRGDKARLQSLGLDLTEHADADSVEVVLHGESDRDRLRRAGFTATTRIADLQARVAANAEADQRYAASTARSGLPSGRTTYRRLADIELELKQLARRYPRLVKPLVLPHPTVEGRDVVGIEITTNPRNTADGKPVFLNMGIHHAREWPAAEHPVEWAYDLLTNYGRDRRTTRLVERTRNIVIPVVNPDGFNVSREAASLPREQRFSVFDYEYKRKNCRISASTPEQFRTGTCDNNPAGRFRGTDPNRNYAGFWGGPGASPTWSSDVFRGDGPFSEAETQNIRELVSGRQVTNLISNHTYSNLVLRPPGTLDTRFPLDEPQYRALGQRMADRNGYANIPSYGLYDTTGATEDWSFWNTGGLGFTFEIGPDEFHPPYETGVVAEYLGLEPAAGAGKGGNRAAYYEMLEGTLDRSLHSTLTGRAPDGWTLRLRKEFVTPTSPVIQADGSTREPILYKDVLTSSLRSRGGRFTWAVNPSTRPYVAGRLGRDPVAPKQADIALANPPGIPAENTGDPLTGPAERIPFTIQGPPQADNGRATVHIEWTNPAVDWDIYILNAAGEIVGQSASGGTREENAILSDPPAGQYTAVVVNYDGGDTDDWRAGAVRFASPLPTTIGPKESWTLTCENRRGQVRASYSVIVDRGETVNLGDACRKRRTGRAGS